jgi:hypothetical protein
MRYLICVWLFVAYAGAAIAVDRPDDFAYGSTLEADGSEALYEITLPATVYRGAARPDLGDVRVFNGAGEVVPHAWRPRKTASAEAPALATLTLFPLKATAGTPVDGLAISVHRSAGGTTRVDVASSDARERTGKRVIGYLVDLTALDRALRAIEFDWPMTSDGFAGKLRVDASDDLAAWRTLVAGAPLISIEVAGQRLQQKRVELPLQKTRYLRLSWAGQSADQPPPELASAHGELAEKSIEAPREWTQIEAGKGEKPGEYVFDLHSHYPIDRVRLDLPESNTIVQVELLAREKTDLPWRAVARGVAYRLRQAGGEITSPEFAVGVTADRYWQLRVDQQGGGVGAGAPKMQVGWVPHRLVFAARGAPPFQLVYGNSQAKPASYAIETMIPGYRDESGAQIRSAKAGSQQTVSVRNAQALAQQELGGEVRRHDAVDWKRLSLWAALIFGVLILGAMAWRLARQIDTRNDATSSQDPDPKSAASAARGDTSQQ